MSEGNEIKKETSDNDDIKREMLKPVTKSKLELDDKLKQIEVQNSGGG